MTAIKPRNHTSAKPRVTIPQAKKDTKAKAIVAKPNAQKVITSWAEQSHTQDFLWDIL